MSSKTPKPRRDGRDAAPEAPLVLEDFLPYRLAVLAHRVSRAIARRYETEFDLTIPEWRVMALLAVEPGLTAREVAEKTPMDKVAISRAVRRLAEHGRLASVVDEGDGRRQRLKLTAKGLGVYGRIAPLARRLEARLLAAVGREERARMDALLTKLDAAARALESEELDEQRPPRRGQG